MKKEYDYQGVSIESKKCDLANVQLRLLSLLDREKLFPKIVNSVLNWTNVRRVSFIVLQDRQLKILATATVNGLSKKLLSQPLDKANIDNSVVGKVFQTGQFIFSNHSSPQIYCLPLTHKQKMIGILYIEDEEIIPNQLNDLSLLVPAIKNACVNCMAHNKLKTANESKALFISNLSDYL